jgi:hypothetical protein
MTRLTMPASSWLKRDESEEGRGTRGQLRLFSLSSRRACCREENVGSAAGDAAYRLCSFYAEASSTPAVGMDQRGRDVELAKEVTPVLDLAFLQLQSRH